MVALMSTRNRRTAKRGKKEREKNVHMKGRNENISFNFFLQVLVLVITDI